MSAAVPPPLGDALLCRMNLLAQCNIVTGVCMCSAIHGSFSIYKKERDKGYEMRNCVTIPWVLLIFLYRALLSVLVGQFRAVSHEVTAHYLEVERVGC